MKKFFLNKNNIIILIFLSIIFCFFFYVIIFYFLPPKIEIDSGEKLNKKYEKKIIISFDTKINLNKWCMVKKSNSIPSVSSAKWQKAKKGKCYYSLDSGKYYIFVKNSMGFIHLINKEKVEINQIIDIKVKEEKIYLALNEKKNIDVELKIKGIVNEKLKWISSNSDIVSVNDGEIEGKSKGQAIITIQTSKGLKKEIEVNVIDIITTPQINNDKKFLTCKQFSEEEAELLDYLLDQDIKNAGKKTRAGVVAAGRFLSLKMVSRVSYFYENGRLNPHPKRPFADGEGRYYHEGLYLSETKYKDLAKIVVGPAMWGCPLMNFEEDGFMFKRHVKYPNGLDCSGFVTWVVHNGGFDPGDIGAGDTAGQADMGDLGEKNRITQELIDSGKIKAGDLIGRDGHIAIIIGIDAENIYIAESLEKGVIVRTMKLGNELIKTNRYSYILLMDSYYNADGNYTAMWN